VRSGPPAAVLCGDVQTRPGVLPSFAIMVMVRDTIISMIGLALGGLIGFGGRADHRIIQSGEAMNDQSGSTLCAHASVEEINGRAADAELDDSSRNVGPAEIFPHSTRELADDWPLSLRGQELGTESGRHKEFMTVFSHELRNSLGAIRSAARILRMETSAGPTAVKARVLIERQVGQMTRLVEDLLDVSRVRSGQLRLQCERIDLCVVAAHAAQTVEFTMQQHNHRMTASFPDAPVWLQADPTRLEQIFINLLFNAAKYTEAGGNVGLSVERNEGEAIVRVRDTGIGIAADVLPRVFDLFIQADPSFRGADAGLGIGLALVRSLVERHGGRVTAASAGLGRGSEFTVRLPMHPE
jgi:signal transduction histidine kinase